MNEGLFDLDRDTSETSIKSLPARDEQVAAIRTALTKAGVVDQQKRQELVESIILNPVASLRELTAVQARRVLDHLKTASERKQATSGSAWDDRGDDTWIDRL